MPQPLPLPFEKKTVTLPCLINRSSSNFLSVPNTRFIQPASNSWSGDVVYEFFPDRRNVRDDNFIHKKIKSRKLPENFSIEHNIPFDAIRNCKSAGIIPYTFVRDDKGNTRLMFLLQRSNNVLRKKEFGWNDFGGKRLMMIDDKTKELIPIETTSTTAAREFSEESSCLFFLMHLIMNGDEDARLIYDKLKDNENLVYDTETVEQLKDLIVKSTKFFADKIDDIISPIYVSSKEIYISYFVKVDFLNEKHIPRAEDIHIHYEDRYIRTCEWITYENLLKLNEKDFHKRLQITKIQHRVRNYYEKGLFT